MRKDFRSRNLEANDNELLGMFVHRQNQEALEQLIRRHSSMVFGVCKSMLWQDADAEDAFQAVFLLLCKKAPKLLIHTSIGGWLHQSAVRISLSHRNRIVRKREVNMSEEDLSHKGNEPWQSIANACDCEMLHREISRLPKRYRDGVIATRGGWCGCNELSELPLERNCVLGLGLLNQ